MSLAQAFRKHYNQTQDFAAAMKEVLSQYVANQENLDNAQRIAQIKAYIESLPSLALGQACITKFSYDDVPELIELFKVAKGIEQGRIRSKERELNGPSPELTALMQESILNASSVLVATCENIVAAQGHSARSIYEQTAILERALVEAKEPYKNHDELKEKIKEWTDLLFKKFAEMILTSNNYQDLEVKVDAIFTADLVQGLPLSDDLRSEVGGQLEYLQKIGFFAEFYDANSASLAEKYDNVYKLLKLTSNSRAKTNELIATIEHLLWHIVDKAYAPIETKKHQLMAKGKTLPEVSEYLHLLAQRRWHAYKNTELHEELETQLKTELETYQCWQKIGELEGQKGASFAPLYQLHSMRYGFSLDEDPQNILAQLQAKQQKSATLKRDYSEADAEAGGSSAYAFTPISVTDMFCDEVLDDVEASSEPKAKDTPKKIKLSKYN